MCIIACISGEPTDLDETLLTLKYAAGARQIRNTPTLVKKVCLAFHESWVGKLQLCF